MHIEEPTAGALRAASEPDGAAAETHGSPGCHPELPDGPRGEGDRLPAGARAYPCLQMLHGSKGVEGCKAD